jgi:N-acetyl sugar amidotransferase
MNKDQQEHQICARGVWDSTVPGISFDEKGVSNYARMYDQLCQTFPRGEEGKAKWDQIVAAMKRHGKGKKYDCIIGVSGGTDSSYLLHMIKKEYGLRPLAVNLDNGWSSDIAVQNIKKVTQALEIDLETYVIDYEEVKSVLRAYMKAGLPWVDGPTDIAIRAILIKTAMREKIKFVLHGADFRSEGKQPSEWTYSDARQMLHIVKKFENKKLKTFPYQTLTNIVYSNIFKGVKAYRPFYYLPYNKKEAQEFLIKTYDWTYYGGHHHENIFTRFAIAYWLPKKFNIDKRIITFSAQILNGEISRKEALAELQKPPYDIELMKQDKAFTIKKLELPEAQFNEIWNKPNRYYRHYPSYMPILNKYFKLSKSFLNFLFPSTPTIVIEKQNR